MNKSEATLDRDMRDVASAMEEVIAAHPEDPARAGRAHDILALIALQEEDAELAPRSVEGVRLTFRLDDGGYWDQVEAGTLPDGPIDPDDPELTRPKLVRLLEEVEPGTDQEERVFGALEIMAEVEQTMASLGMTFGASDSGACVVGLPELVAV